MQFKCAEMGRQDASVGRSHSLCLGNPDLWLSGQCWDPKLSIEEVHLGQIRGVYWATQTEKGTCTPLLHRSSGFACDRSQLFHDACPESTQGPILACEQCCTCSQPCHRPTRSRHSDYPPWQRLAKPETERRPSWTKIHTLWTALKTGCGDTG